MTRLFIPGATEMPSRSTPPPTPSYSSFPHFLIPPFPFLRRESRPARLHPWLASQNAVPPPRSPHSPHSQDKAARCDVYCRSDRSRLPRWVLHMHSACWTAFSTFSMEICKHGQSAVKERTPVSSLAMQQRSTYEGLLSSVVSVGEGQARQAQLTPTRGQPGGNRLSDHMFI
jgi:hypothetical protein